MRSTFKWNMSLFHEGQSLANHRPGTLGTLTINATLPVQPISSIGLHGKAPPFYYVRALTGLYMKEVHETMCHVLYRTREVLLSSPAELRSVSEPYD